MVEMRAMDACESGRVQRLRQVDPDDFCADRRIERDDVEPLRGGLERRCRLMADARRCCGVDGGVVTIAPLIR
jgi:hypothetical protein